ncbi:MAG: type II CAAX prenyl endopeptidase Rce1 family protein [Leptolyngbyaceae cyanobacterium]
MNLEEKAPFLPTPWRRLMLIIMTLLVSVIMGQALLSSWSEPQVASRLELYQTDLLLQATEWEGGDFAPEQVALLRQNLLGEQPLSKAQEAYVTVRETATKTLELADSGDQTVASDRRVQAAYAQQAELLDLLDLRLGILQAEQGETEAAIAAWQQVQSRHSQGSALWATAQNLSNLWQGESANAASEPLLSETLNGWFRNRALTQLYTQTDQANALDQLYLAEQQRAETTLATLALIGVVPVIGCVLGIALLLGLLWQRFQQGSASLLAQGGQRWETPWTGETIWQVLVAGFLFLGQFIVPLLISPLGGVLNGFGSRGQALYALLYYVLMAAGAIAVLAISIRPFRPLSADWFTFKLRSKSWLWGVGGYFVALPLMLAVSFVNQQIWQGQGGSNPLLQTVLEAQDPITLGLFFFTAAVAAPLFEELLFRGFLLPSLTRYLPVWGAISLSSFIFAAAHLSLSEVLPLMVLGMVLGAVYTRSRNLVAPMVLHSAWNSITMLGLFLLGSAA